MARSTGRTDRRAGSKIAAVVFVALSAAGLALAPPALAQKAGDKAPPDGVQTPVAARARVEIVVLHATNEHTGIDPKIGKMPELGKPPFSAYDSYKLLDRAEVDLDRAQPEKRKLPDDGQLAVTLKDIVAPAKKGDEPRFSVAASIQKPGGKSFLPALEVNAKKGEIFFVAGQTYKRGILVIGIRILR